MQEKTTNVAGVPQFSAEAELPRLSFIGQFWEFLQYNKKWWLTPIIIVLLLVAALVILGGTAAAPLIYTLF